LSILGNFIDQVSAIDKVIATATMAELIAAPAALHPCLAAASAAYRFPPAAICCRKRTHFKAGSTASTCSAVV
jgi:hypothetical protein